MIFRIQNEQGQEVNYLESPNDMDLEQLFIEFQEHAQSLDWEGYDERSADNFCEYLKDRFNWEESVGIDFDKSFNTKG